MSAKLSRRSFMKGAAVLSLSAAASTLLTGCDIPTWDELFGPRKGAFTVGESTFVMTLIDCQVPGYPYNQVIPTFTVVNNLGANVSFVTAQEALSKTGLGYQIVPAFTYLDVEDPKEGEEPPEDYYLKTIIPSASAQISNSNTPVDIDLIGEATRTDWPGAKLTLTLYDASGAPVLDANGKTQTIVFTLPL